jgi:hypothetical protein
MEELFQETLKVQLLFGVQIYQNKNKYNYLKLLLIQTIQKSFLCFKALVICLLVQEGDKSFKYSKKMQAQMS